MAILPGRRLGPYEILSAIGAGGMGEVYKARDTRLDRIVAIKVLPTHLADRAELRERFEREAKTIASLNHPHICTLYDTGHQDGIDFLVMEYLEGETLAQRLVKGPLPIDQVLQYAIEIANALDKAHRKGITHRDLKPGNIMLTKSGTKLLDFGLAKLRQGAAPAIPISELPTANDPLTAQGSIVGTLQYMAPEQLEGKEADARTDIFAFGAVVFEMATGKKAFEGKSQASVIGAILKDDPPPISSLQPMTPPALDRVVKKCLAKESEKRWQAASDVCDELKWIAEGGSQAGLRAASVIPSPKSRRKILLWAAASLAASAVVGLSVWSYRPAPAAPPRPVTRFTISLPVGQRLAALDDPALALSPDGTHLAYVAAQGGVQQLYLRAMDSPEVKPMADTAGAAAPFFSPDSQWLGFFVGTKIKKISVNGGAALTVCDGGSSNFHSASWGSDDAIVFEYGMFSGLWKVSAAGGTPQRLTTPRPSEPSNVFPEILSGGKAVLFSAASGTGSQIAIRSDQTGETRDLIAGTRPSYAPTGHLIYAQAGTLMAALFDPERLRLTGSPVPVLEGVLQTAVSRVAQYSFSSTGSIAYITGSAQGNLRKLVWVDRKGTEQPLPAPAHFYQTPRISPDGKRLAVGIADSPPANTWLYNVARETLTRLTFEGGNNTPVWTPDSKRVAFQSSRAGPITNVFWQLADGSGSVERLVTSEYQNAPTSFSPDGQVLAFMEVHPSTGRNIWTVNMSGDRNPKLFLGTQFNEGEARFSPDGRWLLYISDESGRYEVYVRPYPGPGGKYQISTEGGTEPVWGRNGEIFYRSGNKMIAVDSTTQPTFSAGKPKVLFEAPYAPSLQTSPFYDVSADGQRFVMVKEAEEGSSAMQINIVLNWFEELKQKVPTGKK